MSVQATKVAQANLVPQIQMNLSIIGLARAVHLPPK